MTTQDDEQAREDWEELSPPLRLALLTASSYADDDADALIYRSLVKGVISATSEHETWLVWETTPRGQRCAAYGRKVTGG